MLHRRNQNVILREKRPPWQFLEERNISCLSQLCPYTVPSLAKDTDSHKAMCKLSSSYGMYWITASQTLWCIRFHVLSQESLWDCDKVSPGLATWLLDKTGCCASYAMKATTSPAAWGLPKDRWATTGTSVWRNQPVLSMLLVIAVCNYAFSELTMSWNLPVTGISAWESNDFDCWALSAERSKNAWIQGLPFLRKTWPGNHILSTSVVFLGDLKTFWL